MIHFNIKNMVFDVKKPMPTPIPPEETRSGVKNHV